MDSNMGGRERLNSNASDSSEEGEIVASPTTPRARGKPFTPTPRGPTSAAPSTTAQNNNSTRPVSAARNNGNPGGGGIGGGNGNAGGLMSPHPRGSGGPPRWHNNHGHAHDHRFRGNGPPPPNLPQPAGRGFEGVSVAGIGGMSRPPNFKMNPNWDKSSRGEGPGHASFNPGPLPGGNGAPPDSRRRPSKEFNSSGHPNDQLSKPELSQPGGPVLPGDPNKGPMRSPHNPRPMLGQPPFRGNANGGNPGINSNDGYYGPRRGNGPSPTASRWSPVSGERRPSYPRSGSDPKMGGLPRLPHIKDGPPFPLKRQSSQPPPSAPFQQPPRGAGGGYRGNPTNEPRFPDGNPGGKDPRAGPPIRRYPPDMPSRFAAGNKSSKHGDEMSNRKNGPLNRSTSMPPLPPSAATHEADPFGRTRDWKEKSSPAPGKLTKPKMISKSASSPPLQGAPGLAPLSAPSKKPGPILTSSLGDPETVRRADAAVKAVNELLPSSKEKLPLAKDGSSHMPSAQLIMRAVSEQNKSHDTVQAKIESLKKSREETIENEKAEAERTRLEAEKKRQEEETKRLEEEKKRQAEIGKMREEERQKRLKEARLQESLRREHELKQFLSDSEADYNGVLKEYQEEIRAKVQEAKETEEKRLLSEMNVRLLDARKQTDGELSKLQDDVDSALRSQCQTDLEIAKAEADARAAILEDEAIMKEKQNNNGISDLSTLVSKINAENRGRAEQSHQLAFSMLSTIPEPDPEDRFFQHLSSARDPKYGKTSAEWADMIQEISGPADALYTEPSEAPYYKKIKEDYASVGPLVREYVRDKQKTLKKRWIELAEEYDVRRYLYEKEQSKQAKKENKRNKEGSSISSSRPARSSILGTNSAASGSVAVVAASSGSTTSGTEGGRSSNPYRRARRGNEVRSEYEQEQIIAEIAAKEAMEKRIAHGGCKLPRQICAVERRLTASCYNTFVAQKIDDPVEEERKYSSANLWTDTEKCIFLDRFLQFPKDFRRIASFLKNKSTRDCVAFYYDSKQTVPYKGALKEHLMRRKRRGEYGTWDATVQAALSVGALVDGGVSKEKPVTFSLPSSDRTYRTRLLHPLKREVLDILDLDETNVDIDSVDDPKRETKWKSRKRGREPLFLLEPSQSKYLKTSHQITSSTAVLPKAPPPPPPPPPRSALESVEHAAKQEALQDTETFTTLRTASTPGRKPAKWTIAEKKAFSKAVEVHGRSWSLLSAAVGTKSVSQVKSYYNEMKRRDGIPPMKKGKRAEKGTSASESEMTVTPTKKTKSKSITPKSKGSVAVATENDAQAAPVESETPSAPNESGQSSLSMPEEQKQTSTQSHGFNLNGQGFEMPSTHTNNATDNGSVADQVSTNSIELADPSNALIRQLLERQQQQQQQQDALQSSHPHHQQPQHHHQQQQQQAQQQQQPSGIHDLLEQYRLHEQHQQHQQHQHRQEHQHQQPHHHHQLEQERHIQQQIGLPSVEEARRILQEHARAQQQQQHHHQFHHDDQRQRDDPQQQALSNLLPWVAASRMMQSQQRNQGPESNHQTEWEALLQLQQQQQQHHQNYRQHHHQQHHQQQQQGDNDMYGMGQSEQIRSLLLSGGLNPSIASELLSSRMSSERQAGLADYSYGGIDHGHTREALLRSEQPGGVHHPGALAALHGSSRSDPSSNLGHNSATLEALANSSLFRQAAALRSVDSRDQNYPEMSDALSLMSRTSHRSNNESASSAGGANSAGNANDYYNSDLMRYHDQGGNRRFHQ